MSMRVCELFVMCVGSSMSWAMFRFFSISFNLEFGTNRLQLKSPSTTMWAMLLSFALSIESSIIFQYSALAFGGL